MSLCACGCGESLAPDSKWKYKRGHKSNPPGSNSESFNALNESEEYTEPETPFTLDDAAASTPDDPEPPASDAKKPQTYVRITKRVKDDIEGKLAMTLGFAAMGVSAKDPVCGTSFAENSDVIAAKLVPIICKSPDLVRWFTKGGDYMLWFDLAMACLPVIKTMAAHHVFNTTRPNLTVVDPMQPDFSAYSVE